MRSRCGRQRKVSSCKGQSTNPGASWLHLWKYRDRDSSRDARSRGCGLCCCEDTANLLSKAHASLPRGDSEATRAQRSWR
jgi:hypothetical protein